MTKSWLEVWVDSSPERQYLLVVRPLSDGRFAILDPQEKWRVAEFFESYEDAVHWLNEDEYDLVEGRWFPS